MLNTTTTPATPPAMSPSPMPASPPALSAPPSPSPTWDGTGSPLGYSSVPGNSAAHGNFFKKSVGHLEAFIAGPHPTDGTFKTAVKDTAAADYHKKTPFLTHATPQAAHAAAEGSLGSSTASPAPAADPFDDAGHYAAPPLHAAPRRLPATPAAPAPAVPEPKFVTVPKNSQMVKTPLTDDPVKLADVQSAKADYNLSSKAETTLHAAVASGKLKTQGDLAQAMAMTHAINQGSGYNSLTGFSLDKALAHGTVAKMKAAAEADPAGEAAGHAAALGDTNILSPAGQKKADADAAFSQQSGDDLTAKKVGAQAGSNPGGFYKTKAGDDVYAKFHADPQQAHSEHAANQIYRALGLSAPLSTVAQTSAGKTVYGSKIIPNQGTLGSKPLTPELAKDALRGHAADILLGNHDVTGQGLDNLVHGQDGHVSRIDNGGALLYRAQGAKKSGTETGQIDAWNGFSNPAHNPDYAKLFQAASVKDAAHVPGMAKQIGDIQSLEAKHGGWDGFLQAHAPGMDDATRQKTAAMLTKRTALLGQKRDELLDKEGGSVKALAGKTSLSGGASKSSSQWGSGPIAQYAQKIDAMTSTEAEAHFKQLYTGHKHVYDALTGPINKWTGSSTGHDWHTDWPAALDGQETLGALKVQQALKTRRDRWQKLADTEGVPFPETFHVHRGTADSDGTVLPHIIAAWQNENEPYMRLKAHPAASWSLSKDAAKGFYGGTNGALYETHVPFSQTLADKYVDDKGFLHSFPSEHEVVVGGSKDGVIAPKSGVTAKYKGTEYSYADRQKLFDAWQQDHGSLPSPKHFGIDVAEHQKNVGYQKQVGKVQLRERNSVENGNLREDEKPDYKNMTGAEYMKQLQKETAAFQAPLIAGGVTPAPPDGTVKPLGSFAEARAEIAAEEAQDAK